MRNGCRTYHLPPHGYTLHVYPSLWTLHDCGFLDTELLLLFLRRHLEARCPSCQVERHELHGRTDAFAAAEYEAADELLATSRSAQLAELKRLRRRHSLPSTRVAAALVDSIEEEDDLSEEAFELLDFLVEGFSLQPRHQPTAVLACRALVVRAEHERRASRVESARSDLARSMAFLGCSRVASGDEPLALPEEVSVRFNWTLGRMYLSEEREEEALELLLHAALVGRSSGAESPEPGELERFHLPYPRAFTWLSRDEA